MCKEAKNVTPQPVGVGGREVSEAWKVKERDGHTPDDLNSGTPSVQRIRPVCSATEKKIQCFLYLFPSWMSLSAPGISGLVKGY